MVFFFSAAPRACACICKFGESNSSWTNCNQVITSNPFLKSSGSVVHIFNFQERLWILFPVDSLALITVEKEDCPHTRTRAHTQRVTHQRLSVTLRKTLVSLFVSLFFFRHALIKTLHDGRLQGLWGWKRRNIFHNLATLKLKTRVKRCIQVNKRGH